MKEKLPTEQIDDIINLYGGWKGKLLSQLREVILAADSSAIEEVKWKMRTRPEGLPVWSHDGILCLAETFKDNIKLVFVNGAQMSELQVHFNSRLQSSSNRAIEYHDGDTPDTEVITALVHEAVQLNAKKTNTE